MAFKYASTSLDLRQERSSVAGQLIEANYLDSLVTPLPATLPLLVTGLGALGLLGWRRKRKNAAAIVAA